jgi:hypothetical protein
MKEEVHIINSSNDTNSDSGDVNSVLKFLWTFPFPLVFKSFSCVD